MHARSVSKWHDSRNDNHALFNVEDKVEHSCGQTKTDEVEDFVIERYRVRDVREAQESENKHDTYSKQHKPLEFVSKVKLSIFRKSVSKYALGGTAAASRT